MFLSSSDTRRTLMHLFLFTNSGQRELVSICTKSIRIAINFPCIITLIGPIYLCSLQLEFTISWASLNNLDYILELLYLQISCTLPSLSNKLAQSDAKLGIMSFTSSKLKQALCSIIRVCL